MREDHNIELCLENAYLFEPPLDTPLAPLGISRICCQELPMGNFGEIGGVHFWPSCWSRTRLEFWGQGRGSGFVKLTTGEKEGENKTKETRRE